MSTDSNSWLRSLQRELRNREEVKAIMKDFHEKVQDMWNHPDNNHYSKLMKRVLKFMLNGLAGLQKYLEDGNYDIDNRLRELVIRPFTVGRSICKGFTSEGEAKIADRSYTLVVTCKLNSVPPMDYFVKVLEALTDDNGDFEKQTPNRINEI